MENYFGDAQQGAAIAEELGISHQQWESLKAELDPVLSADGNTVIGYTFEVPAAADAALLAQTGWAPGARVEVSVTAVDSEPDKVDD